MYHFLDLYLPSMWETRVRSLGWEDPLEKEVAITPVFLPGESHGQRSLVGYSPWGRKESDMTERLHLFTSLLPFIYKALLWDFFSFKTDKSLLFSFKDMMRNSKKW